MTPRGRLFRQIIFQIIVVMSPFLIYKGVKLAQATPEGKWPADIAVVDVAGKNLTGLSLLHYGSKPVIAKVPIESILSVPDSGEIRATTTFRIGGAGLLASSLQQTVGFEVPYWITRGAPDSNLDRHFDEVNLILSGHSREAPTVFTAPGHRALRGTISYYILDVKAFFRSLSVGHLSQSVAVPSVEPTSQGTPAATPAESSISSVSVEVLNQGGEAGQAGRVADSLKSVGFTAVKVGNTSKPSVDGLRVYYKTRRDAALGVGGYLGADEVSALPRAYTSIAEVVVVVGRGSVAGSTASPGPSP